MTFSLSEADQQTLAGLRQRDNRAYTALYTHYYPVVERLVLRNSGTRAHAQDVFQETLLVLLDKATAPEFTLTSSLKTYLVAISSNLWLKRLRETGRVVPAGLTELEAALPAAESEAFAHEASATAHAHAQGLLARISAKCQALIRALFFGQQTIQAITQQHGYTSVHNAQNQKYKCLEQARRGARAGCQQP